MGSGRFFEDGLLGFAYLSITEYGTYKPRPEQNIVEALIRSIMYVEIVPDKTVTPELRVPRRLRNSGQQFVETCSD